MNEAQALIESRRTASSRITAILEKSGFDSKEKIDACNDFKIVHHVLSQCNDIASVHCAMTGDDSLMIKPLKSTHEVLMKKLPEIIEAAQQVKREGCDSLI